MIASADTSHISVIEERRHIVRLCAHLTGSEDAAEDLAQETLVEAWRHEQSLRDPDKRRAWLHGIARNVCKRWLRGRHRDLRYAMDAPREEDLGGAVGETDVEVELEREELATLLDRAMSYLPPHTRDLLVERFVNERSHAEIAARLGLTEGAVHVRVHRGRLALQRVLSVHFARDLEMYGVGSPADGWTETRVWCPTCGTRRLQMRSSTDQEGLRFRCPSCDVSPGSFAIGYSLANPRLAAILSTLKRPAAILRRGSEWIYAYFTAVAVGDRLPCTGCGLPVVLRTYVRPGDDLPDRLQRGLYVRCAVCGEEMCTSRSGLAVCSPHAQRLLREVGRIRVLPEQTIEARGRPAVVTRVESIASAASLDVISDAESYRILATYVRPRPAPAPASKLALRHPDRTPA